LQLEVIIKTYSYSTKWRTETLTQSHTFTASRNVLCYITAYSSLEAGLAPCRRCQVPTRW